jgi:hypothetical protein
VSAARDGATRKTVRSVRVEDFMVDMAECTIGDPSLTAHTDEALDRLADELAVQSVLAVEVMEGDREARFTSTAFPLDR